MREAKLVLGILLILVGGWIIWDALQGKGSVNIPSPYCKAICNVPSVDTFPGNGIAWCDDQKLVCSGFTNQTDCLNGGTPADLTNPGFLDDDGKSPYSCQWINNPYSFI